LGVLSGVGECFVVIRAFYPPGDTLSALSEKIIGKAATKSTHQLSGFGCGFAALGHPWLKFIAFFCSSLLWLRLRHAG
jgi:hypothetical protein